MSFSQQDTISNSPLDPSQQFSPPPLPVLSPPDEPAFSAPPPEFKDIKALTNGLTGFLITTLLLTLVKGVIYALLLNQPFSYGPLQSEARFKILQYTDAVIYLTTTLVFCRWIYLSAKNVHSLGARGLNFTPGWAVGYYFIPLFSLWKPYLAMREIWQASHSPENWKVRRDIFPVALWWSFWLLNQLGDNVAVLALIDAKRTGNYEDLVTKKLVSSCLFMLLCLAAIYLIRRINAAQRKNIGREN